MKKPYYLSAANIIRQARKTAEISREELSRLSGVSVDRLVLFEQAKQIPEMPLLEEIVACCGLQIRYTVTDPDTNLQDGLVDSLSRSIEDRFSMNMNTVRFALNLRAENGQ